MGCDGRTVREALCLSWVSYKNNAKMPGVENLTDGIYIYIYVKISYGIYTRTLEEK